MSSTVLIVEDDVNLTLAMATRLRHAGHQVITATDAEVAVRAAREHAPDAVILDLGIPAGGGFVAAERIRSLASTAHVPIIVITGSEDFRCRLAAAELGVAGYLSKPFDAAQLLKILQVCTEGAG